MVQESKESKCQRYVLCRQTMHGIDFTAMEIHCLQISTTLFHIITTFTDHAQHSYMVWEEQRNCEPRLAVTTFGAESLCVENEYVVFPPSVLFHVCGGSFSAVCHRDNAICTHSPPSHSLRRSINTNTRTHCLPP